VQLCVHGSGMQVVVVGVIVGVVGQISANIKEAGGCLCFASKPTSHLAKAAQGC